MNNRSSKLRVLLLVVGATFVLTTAMAGAAAADSYDPAPGTDTGNIVADPATASTSSTHTSTVTLDDDIEAGADADEGLGAVNVSYPQSSDISLSSIDESDVTILINGDAVDVSSSATFTIDDTANFINISNADGLDDNTDLGSGDTIAVEIRNGITNPSSTISGVETTVTVTDTSASNFNNAAEETITGQELTVDSGPIRLADQSTGTQFQTFDNAVEAADSNTETVFINNDVDVEAGNDFEQGSISSDIAIVGNNGATLTTVSAGTADRSDFIDVDNVGSLTIQDLTFDDSGGVGSPAIVSASNTDSLSIQNNTFDNFGGTFIIDAQDVGDDLQIDQNTFSSTGNDVTHVIQAGEHDSNNGDNPTGDVTISDNALNQVSSSNTGEDLIAINASEPNLNTLTVNNNSITFNNDDNGIVVSDNTDGDITATINISANANNPAVIGGNSGAAGVVYEPGSGSAGETFNLNDLKFDNVNKGVAVTGGAVDLSASGLNMTNIDTAGLEVNSGSVETLSITDIESSTPSADADMVFLNDITGLTSSPTLQTFTHTDTNNQNGDVVRVDSNAITHSVTVSDVTVDGAEEAIDFDTPVGSQQKITITNFQLTNITNFGVATTTDSRDVTVSAGSVKDSSASSGAILHDGNGNDLTSTVTIDNVQVDQGDSDNVGIDVAATNDIGRLTIRDSVVNNTGTGTGITIDPGTGTHEYNTIELTNVSTTFTADGTLFDGGAALDASNINVTDSTISNNDNTFGIQVTGSVGANTAPTVNIDNLNADNNDLSAGVVDVQTGATIQDVLISSSTINDSTNAVDYNDPNVNNNGLEITDSEITNNSNLGLDLVTSSGNTLVVNNNVLADNADHDIGSGAVDEVDLTSNFFGGQTGPKLTDTTGNVQFNGTGDSLNLADTGMSYNSDTSIWIPFLDSPNGNNVTGFEGQVTDPQGNAITNQDVTFTINDNNGNQLNTFTATTDGNGRYVALTPSGDGTLFRVTSATTGVGDSDQQSLFIPDNQNFAFNQDFQQKSGGTVEGSISGPDGQAIEFASAGTFDVVDASDNTVLATTGTNAGGNFSVTLSPGTKDVFINSSNNPRSSAATVEITSGSTDQQSFTLGGQVNGTIFSPDGTVFNSTGSDVNFTNTATGETVEFGSEVSTNDDGTFVFPIEAGTFDLQAENSSLDPSDTQTVTVEEGTNTTQNFTLNELATASLTATITNASSGGEAVADTEVTLTAGDSAPSTFEQTLTTDSNGQVSTRIPADDQNTAYQLTAAVEGFENTTRGVAPAPGDSVSRTFNITVEEAGTGSPLDGPAGRFDNNGDGDITVSELGDAGTAFAQGELTVSELGEVGEAFAS